MLLAGAAWIWFSDPGTREQTLPDGSIVRLRAVTHGTRHRVVSGNLWQRTVGRLLPETWALHLGSQILSHTNDVPVTVVWIDYEDQGSTRRPTGGYRATPTIVSDGEGTEFEQVGASISRMGTNNLTEGFIFGAFPRTGRIINVTVNPFDYVSNLSYQAQFSMPNPAYNRAEITVPTAFPVEAVDNELTFLLKAFHPIRRGGGRGSGDEAWMSTRYEIIDRLQPTNRWRVRGVSVLDGGGGSYWPSAQGGRPEVTRTNMDFRGGLTTNASWTLRFQLANLDYSSNDVFIAKNLPLPGRSNRLFEPVSATLHGVTIRVTGIRMKSYVFAELSPLDENLHFELVQVVDDQQRPVERGGSGEQGGTNYHFGLKVETDANALDLTFALRPKRHVDIKARPQPAPANAD